MKISYNFDVLTAIGWTETEWNNFPCDVIRNCFNHFLKQNWQDVANLDSKKAEKDTVSQMTRNAEEHGVQVKKAVLQFTLNPDGENCVTEEISIEDLAREVANISDGDDNAENKEESEVKKIMAF